jgi:hypothetical protein
MIDLEQELEAKSFDGILRCRYHNLYQSVWATFHRPKRGQLLRICTECHTPVCRSCRCFLGRKPYCLKCAEQRGAMLTRWQREILEETDK